MYSVMWKLGKNKVLILILNALVCGSHAHLYHVDRELQRPPEQLNGYGCGVEILCLFYINLGPNHKK